MNAAPEPSRARHPGRRVAAAVLALAAAGATAYAVWPFERAAPAPATPIVATSVATVRLGGISQVEQAAATLGYDAVYQVTCQAAGVITWLPWLGATVEPGGRLYDVNGDQVVLLRGGTPAWRTFALGMSDGADVKELKQALRDLGFDPWHAMTVDQHFDAPAAAAVNRLLAAHGVPYERRTGALPLGSVVFLPEAIRVTQTPIALGGSTPAGVLVLAATSTRRAVLMQLPVNQQNLVAVGDAVRVQLPDGTSAPGHVASVGHAAAAQDPGAAGRSTGSVPTLTVDATVTLDAPLPAADAALDQAPVQVSITTSSHQHVLTAPITALLAGPNGSYQVRVIANGAHTLVTVTTGLFDDVSGTVEISGAGITDGTQVEVPAS